MPSAVTEDEDLFFVPDCRVCNGSVNPRSAPLPSTPTVTHTGTWKVVGPSRGAFVSKGLPGVGNVNSLGSGQMFAESSNLRELKLFESLVSLAGSEIPLFSQVIEVTIQEVLSLGTR